MHVKEFELLEYTRIFLKTWARYYGVTKKALKLAFLQTSNKELEKEYDKKMKQCIKELNDYWPKIRKHLGKKYKEQLTLEKLRISDSYMDANRGYRILWSVEINSYKDCQEIKEKYGYEYSLDQILQKIANCYKDVLIPTKDLFKKLPPRGTTHQGQAGKGGKVVETGKEDIGDKTIDEAKRLLEFISGFKEPPGEQPGDTRNDPQIQRIIGFLEDKLQSPKKILDYGCGKGPLITELANLNRFMGGPHQYIGVNHGSVKDAEEQAKKCGLHKREIPPCFYTTEEFEKLKEPLIVDLIFMRNVIHEIPLKELGKRFYYVLKSLKIEGKLYVLDMCMLSNGEAKSVTWENEDFIQFFGFDSLDVKPNPYESKGGIPLIAVLITKNSNDIPFEKELFNRALKLFESKKLRTKKAMELYEKSESNITEFQYAFLQNQYSNIQRHLDEV